VVSFFGELLSQVVFEFAAYAVGKGTAFIFLPHLGIEPLKKQKSMPPWRWRGFTYEQNGRRHLYTEAIQLLGLAVLFVIGIGIVAMVRSTIT
jgi:hypothetical protein